MSKDVPDCPPLLPHPQLLLLLLVFTNRAPSLPHFAMATSCSRNTAALLVFPLQLAGVMLILHPTRLPSPSPSLCASISLDHFIPLDLSISLCPSESPQSSNGFPLLLESSPTF